mgnify:FL=1
MPMPTAPISTPTPEEALRRALEAHGQRYTEQRAAVYRYLCAHPTHPSADEVFLAVRREIPDISLATVYKALETLVQVGLVCKLPYADGSARFDARTDEHAHARCRRCGRVWDVPLDVGRLRAAQVPEGFEVEAVHLELVGFCPGCSSAV